MRFPVSSVLLHTYTYCPVKISIWALEFPFSKSYGIPAFLSADLADITARLTHREEAARGACKKCGFGMFLFMRKVKLNC